MTRHITIRLDKDIYDQIIAQAQAMQVETGLVVTLSSYATLLLREGVEKNAAKYAGKILKEKVQR